MKRIAFFLLSFFISVLAMAQDIPAAPNPPRLVNDFAHVLTADQINSLEQKLVAYDDSTSIQIAVVTVRTTGDYAIEDYALKILRNWGVGNKKTNNGLVILAAIDDHKVYIATGYGMEGAVPDITAKQIVENEIVPNFKAGGFYQGFNNASDAIIKAAAGEYKAPEGYTKRGRGSGGGGGFGIILFIIIIIVISIASRGGGGPRGGVMNRTGFLPWIIASMLSDSGRGGGWGGGGSSGGGWSGGGGGGGFGGFGGGSGGGGGAGGSW